MWSQPKLSMLVHAAVATALLGAYCAVVLTGMRAQHPDWYKTGLTVLLPVSALNYLAAAFHMLRWLRVA